MTRCHAVCHDCDAEGIEPKATAHELAEGHADRHGHNVAVAEVER